MTDESVAAIDWADAQRLVSREFFPHVLRPLRAGTLPRLTFRSIRLGPLTVAHIDWGADVSVATEHAAHTGSTCRFPGTWSRRWPGIRPMSNPATPPSTRRTPRR